MHRISSVLAARYPHGTRSRRVARTFSPSPALFRKIPVQQGIRADSHGRVHGAHLSEAQRFDWLGVQVVHMRHVGKRTNVMLFPPRSHRGAGISALSRGLTYPDRLVTVRIRRDPPPACDPSACSPVARTAFHVICAAVTHIRRLTTFTAAQVTWSDEP